MLCCLFVKNDDCADVEVENESPHVVDSLAQRPLSDDERMCLAVPLETKLRDVITHLF